LTPIEHWFLNQDPRDAHHFNQALFFESTEALDTEIVRESLKHLIEHHDALRSRLRRGHDGWTKEIVEPGLDVPFETVEVPDLDAAARRAFVEREAARIQASLDLERGPVLRLALFRAPDAADHLLFVIHHLAVDAVSWPILVQDLERAMASLRRGQPVELPPKSTSVKRWAEALVGHAATREVAAQASYWLESPLQDIGRVPRDQGDGDNTVSTIGTVAVSLSENATAALLQRVPAAYGTRIDDVLLTALVRTLGRWTGHQRHIVDIEGHGRHPFAEGLDPSRTVGWFTSLYPAPLAAPTSQPLGEALKGVKEQLRALPASGLAHGLARWIAPDAALSDQLGRIPPAEVAFNYLGRFDGTDGAGGGLLRPSDWPCGPMRSPQMQRAHLLEINAVIRDGRFTATWAFSRAVHREETVKHVAGGFLGELAALIEHCESPEAGGYTPSDFGDFGWNQDDLDDILSEAEGGK
jgi:non-ribosomal peptide synthase protein (TIGR01720 family)